MIDECEPADWRDLQQRATLVLAECGMEAECDRLIVLARGKAAVDVWAYDSPGIPPALYLLECKRWKSPIPQTVIHSFRTVVADAGANAGFIISSRGFQKGARGAVAYSNVKLVTWRDFEKIFEDRWFGTYFGPTMLEAIRPFLEYNYPLNAYIGVRADSLPRAKRRRYDALRTRYQYPALALNTMLRTHLPKAVPSLPLRNSSDSFTPSLPDHLLEASAFRPLGTAIRSQCEVWAQEFDEVFGKRVGLWDRI